MSTRHTTVGQLTADDLGKRVEGDGWVIEELHVVSHFGGAYDTPLYRPAGPDWTGSLPRMITYDTPCIVTDPPTPEPLDPAYRHVDKSGTELARIDDIWVSPDQHPLSWEDLLERHGTRGDS